MFFPFQSDKRTKINTLRPMYVIWLIGSIIILQGCASMNTANSSYTGYDPSRNTRFYMPQNWNVPIGSAMRSGSKESRYTDYTAEKRGTGGNSAASGSTGAKPAISANGVTYSQPTEQMEGVASWYGPNFHGKRTANGETYNQFQMTAAHKYLPMNSLVRVKNKGNGKEVIVRINDRGPYVDDRIIDLSRAAAEKIDMVKQGTAPVSLTIIQYPNDFDHSAGIKAYRQAVIQLAVFNNPANAKNYKDGVAQRYRGLAFFVDNPKTNSYHVVIGPYDDRNEAKRVSQNLQSDGVNAMVRSYRK